MMGVAVCCGVTVHLTLVADGRSGLADMERRGGERTTDNEAGSCLCVRSQ